MGIAYDEYSRSRTGQGEVIRFFAPRFLNGQHDANASSWHLRNPFVAPSSTQSHNIAQLCGFSAAMSNMCAIFRIRCRVLPTSRIEVLTILRLCTQRFSLEIIRRAGHDFRSYQLSDLVLEGSVSNIDGGKGPNMNCVACLIEKVTMLSYLQRSLPPACCDECCDRSAMLEVCRPLLEECRNTLLTISK